MPLKEADVSVQYAKNKNLTKEDVEALQRWVVKQPHLPKISELQLILFLQSCYSSIESSKSTIDAFYTLKTHVPSIFGNRDPKFPTTLDAMECGLHVVLPKNTPEGYTVMYQAIIDSDPSKFVISDQVKVFDMAIRTWLQENGTTEGFLFVINMENFSLGHLTRLNLSAMKSYFHYVQDAIPVRLKGLHIINAATATEKLLALCRPFIKPSLNEILHLYSSANEVFFKAVAKECLPLDHGGCAPTIVELHGIMKAKLLDSSEFLLEDEKFKIDEGKRLEKGYNVVIADDGLDGSFKRLEVD